MPPATQNPNPNYDFIFSGNTPPKRSTLPGGINPIFLIAGVVIIILVLVIVLSSLFGSKSSVDKASLTDVIGQAQEINRISSAQSPLLKDPATLSLATTAAAVTNSDQVSLSSYLKSHKVNIDKNALAVYATNDKSIDSQLQQAGQSNTLDQAYTGYLKTALNNYASSLKKAYAANSSTNIKALLQSSFNSTETLLSSPLVKS